MLQSDFIFQSIPAVSRCLGNTIDPEERRKQLAEFHRQGDIIGVNHLLNLFNFNQPYVQIVLVI